MPKDRVIVILVPGILASHLIDETPSKPSIGWPVNSQSAMLKHLQASPNRQRKILTHGKTFKVNGPSEGIPNFAKNRGWKDIPRNIYLPFLEDCENNTALKFKPIVYAVGYNFTKSNKTSGRDLREKTRSILKNASSPNLRFIYVTHSMGALTARAALKIMDQPTYRKCIGVIHVAAPNDGSPETMMRFVRGVKPSKPSSVPSQAVSLIMGDQGWKVTTVGSALPALFELLPHNIPSQYIKYSGHEPQSKGPYYLEPIARYHFLLEREPTNSIMDRWRWWKARQKGEEIIKGIRKNTEEAIDFMRYIKDYMFPRTRAVCLRWKPDTETTVTEVTLTFDASGNFKEGRPTKSSKEGDGSVPITSQKYKLINSHYKVVDGVEHADPFKEIGKTKGVFRAIYDYMDDLYGAYQNPNNNQS